MRRYEFPLSEWVWTPMNNYYLSPYALTDKWLADVDAENKARAFVEGLDVDERVGLIDLED